MGEGRGLALRRIIAKGVLLVLAAVLVVLGAALVTIQTSWAKEKLRGLVVSQAGRYLTADLEIGRLEGSLFSGVRLVDVTLSREGTPLVSIDEVSAEYSLRELVQDDLVLRSLRLVRPRIAATRLEDGRWDLSALLRRRPSLETGQQTIRPIRIEGIELVDAEVVFGSPLVFGAARVPTRITALNTSMSFERSELSWTLDVKNLSFSGSEPELSLDKFTGGIGGGPAGWSFTDLHVETPRSAFTIAGRTERASPTVFDLHVRAEAFAFEEWAGIVPGLRFIGVESAFDVVLKGPRNNLSADVDLSSNGGDIDGVFVLDTTVPGWHAKGSVALTRLDLAHWMKRADRPSDITGRVEFDLDLDLGRRFPRGSYAFEGPHARFLEYEGDDVRATGRITASEVLVDEGMAAAYGARVRISDGSIGIDKPLPFRFRGTVSGLDLRRLPRAVPVPHVESTLAFEYDVAGRFQSPFISGNASFAASRFLGATVGAGSVGSIDTAVSPFTYSGEGDVRDLSLERLAADVGLEWLKPPRYAGSVTGHFRVEGTGGDVSVRTMSGGGRLARANLFGGTLANADVTVSIRDGSLEASYDGAFADLNPATAAGNPRLEARLTGAGKVRLSVNDLLYHSPAAHDVTGEANVRLEASSVRGVQIDTATVTASIEAGTLQVQEAVVSGPEVDARGAGTIELDRQRDSDFEYEVNRADLAVLRPFLEMQLAGLVTTTGRLSGPLARPRLAGDGTASQLDAGGVRALTVNTTYDATLLLDEPARSTASLVGNASFVEAAGQTLDGVTGTATYDDGDVTFDLQIARPDLAGSLAGIARLPRTQTAELASLRIGVKGAEWQLVPSAPPATLTWDSGGLAVTPAQFTDVSSGGQRLGISGTWRYDGSGALRVTAEHVALETLPGIAGDAPPYGGLLTLDSTITGTLEQPIATGSLTIANGRVRQLSYELITARIEYIGGMFEIGVRLDQSPGVWLTAAGAVPLGLIDRRQPERPMHVSIASTPVSLGLIEGLTNVVHDVTGQIQLSVAAVGTSHDPRFTGSVGLSETGFVVTSTGARYANGRGTMELTRDRVTVNDLQLEDSGGHPLQVTGSVGTSELRFEDLELEVVARDLEVLRNEFGTASVDAALGLRGTVEAPEVTGAVTFTSGQLRADRILDRVLFRPYALDARPSAAPLDAIAALNPWDRLAMNIEVHVPGTLRMTGDNVQVASGTPLGLGNIDLRVAGDLRLRKGPAETLSVTGALDQVTGRYAFQGRRFDLDPASSITFRGDLNPELFITVHRLISGVDVRVTISGPLADPELRLASVPPLDSSDILSLIVFNTSANELSAAQQEQLAVRAGTLAAGFLAAPLVAALERSIGIDLLEIEAAETGGARVTIGDEIAPGLVARFSRHFGTDEYDEATIEYYLSRMFRIRGTFSDAGSTIRSPFRRVERAGVDLLLFFSF